MEIKTKFKPNDYCYPIFLIETEWNEEFNEKDCFVTQAEAQAECDRRNKGE